MIDLSCYGEGRQAKKLMRRDHLTALQRISEIEGAIEQINHFIESTRYGPDHQRYALLKEKEKLILELQRFELYVRTEEERVCFCLSESVFKIVMSFAHPCSQNCIIEIPF